MASITTLPGGTKVVTPTPTNDAALALNQNFTAQDNHLLNTSNPHSTTAAQVGAYTTGQVDTALAAKLPLTGGTLTGALSVGGGLTVSGDIVVNGNNLRLDNGTNAAATISWDAVNSRVNFGAGLNLNGSLEAFWEPARFYSLYLHGGLTMNGSTISLNDGSGSGGTHIQMDGGDLQAIGSLVFADSTTQTTAYTGAPNLSAVLAAGEDAGGNGITNLDSIQLDTSSTTIGLVLNNKQIDFGSVSGSPSNTSSPAGWIPILVSGGTAYLPYYT